MTRRLRFVAAVGACALVLTACGGDDKKDETAATSSAPAGSASASDTSAPASSATDSAAPSSSAAETAGATGTCADYEKATAAPAADSAPAAVASASDNEAVVQAAPVKAGLAARQEAKTIRLVAANYNPTTKGYWDKLVKDFESKNPDVKVKVEMFDWPNVNEFVGNMVASKNYPDILNRDTFSAYAANNLLHPAKDIVSQSVLDDFIPSFAKDGVIDDVQYGLPFIGSSRAFFYNKDIFAKAGITEPPTDWASFIAAAKKIKEAGFIGYGLPLGQEDAQGEFSMWSWGNGGNWMDGGKYVINSPQNVEAMKMLNCLANEWKVTQPQPGKTIRSDVFKLFGEGKVGMITGASFLPTVLKGSKSTVNFGVSTVPTHGDNKPITLGVQDYMMAFKKDGNAEPVKKFLDFFYSKDNYVRFCQEEGFLPVTNQGVDALKDDPAFKDFLGLVKDARFYPQTDPAWTKTVGALKSTLGTAVEEGANPEKVLTDLQKQAEGG